MGCFLKYHRNNSLKNPADRNSDDKKFDRLQEAATTYILWNCDHLQQYRASL